jgi:CheY-like chemotaxis protein
MKIHVLDDEFDVRCILRLILEQRAYSVSETTSAAKAVEMCIANRPDLLIADVNLPVSSGIDVALELRSKVPAVKVILTSGAPLDCLDEQQAAQLQDLPSDSMRFLRKPFTVADVFETVDSLISRIAPRSMRDSVGARPLVA